MINCNNKIYECRGEVYVNIKVVSVQMYSAFYPYPCWLNQCKHYIGNMATLMMRNAFVICIIDIK
jgi:hypothetical protein